MHVLYGGFGIGSFLIPLIANPVLAVPLPNSHSGYFNDTTEEAFTVLRDTTSSVPESALYLKESRIEFAFLIPAVLTISLSLVFHGYHFLNIRKEKKLKMKSVEDTLAIKSLKLKQMLNPATCAGGGGGGHNLRNSSLLSNVLVQCKLCWWEKGKRLNSSYLLD